MIGYRWYSPGRINILDDERFEKITIELDRDALSSSSPVALELPTQAHLAYTRGGAAWPRSACYGIAKNGSVTLGELSKKRVTVSIRATIEPIRETGGRCDDVEFDREFEAKRLAFPDLTPWLGLAGEHPCSETYRQAASANEVPNPPCSGSVELVFGCALAPCCLGRVESGQCRCQPFNVDPSGASTRGVL